MSDTDPTMSKHGYVLDVLSRILPGTEGGNSLRAQPPDHRRGLRGELSSGMDMAGSGVAEVVGRYRDLLDRLTESGGRMSGGTNEPPPAEDRGGQELKVLIEAGFVLDALHPMPDLPVQAATVIRRTTGLEKQVGICQWLAELPEKLAARHNAAHLREGHIREGVAATLLQIWASYENNRPMSDRIQNILEGQLVRMKVGSLERIVSRQMADAHLTFSSSVAGLLMEWGRRNTPGVASMEGAGLNPAVAGGTVAGGTEGKATPVGEIKKELKVYMQRHPRRVGQEHLELAMWLAAPDGKPENRKTMMESVSDELFPVVYQTLVTSGLSPRVRAAGYALVSPLLTEGQRQTVWEVQLESLPSNIPPVKEYWSPEVKRGMAGVEAMVNGMDIMEVMERMRMLSPVLKESLHPEVMVPVISRLGAVQRDCPVYAEPPSRIMLRELMDGLPAAIRSRPEVACHEAPDNEVALNWEFVRDCLSRDVDLPVLPPGDREATMGGGRWLEYFPRTSRHGVTHLGNVAEFVMRQAGKGNLSCVGYTYEVLPWLTGEELKERLSREEVQTAIASNSSLETVVFFEIRRREGVAGGGPEKMEWDELRKQFQTTGILLARESPERGTGESRQQDRPPDQHRWGGHRGWSPEMD